jgi:hypothetical protein
MPICPTFAVYSYQSIQSEEEEEEAWGTSQWEKTVTMVIAAISAF